MHTLLATGRADRHFLETRTTGFETLEACLNGRLDGVVRDAAWAAGICGLDEKTIRDFAEELAAHRTMIMLGWGPQRARYGESTVWAVWALAAALGQIGGRGTGIGTRYHYSSGGAGASAGSSISHSPCQEAPSSARRIFASIGVPSSLRIISPNSARRFTSRSSISPSRLGGRFRWKQAFAPTLFK